MRFIIVTGISGAGKTTTLKFFEDMGYFCVDNLPISLITKFAELSRNEEQYNVRQIALGIDIRGGQALSELQGVLEELNKQNHSYEILFLEADNATLIKRYKESRRSHPLAPEGNIEEGIRRERKELDFLAKQADYTINTSTLLTKELKMQLESIFKENKEYKNLFVTVMSFGFKYGIPADADLLFDVRFMPNPYYIDSMKQKTGNDKEVRDYVTNNPVTKEFMERLTGMVRFLIPNYISEGKSQLVIAVGCTGGRHRSVTIANELYEDLSKDANYGIKILHRDVEK
ncbi:MAG: RNase adapter RapZ [Lachnospiraceae bacterium]|nr:RNase adapter RapZ [Lachnospiraceae bacterium]